MSTTNISSHDELSSFPIARIDTIDENFVYPIREYLRTNGCQVTVNGGDAENVTYHIVVGDWDFVKSFIDKRKKVNENLLCISWDTGRDPVCIQQQSFLKIVYIDPTELSKKNIAQIFSYFFTGKEKELDLQSDSVKHEHKRKAFFSPIIPPEEQESTDRRKKPLFVSEELHAPVQFERSFLQRHFPEKPFNIASVKEDEERVLKTITSLYGKEEKGKRKPRFNHITKYITQSILLTFFVFCLPFLWYGISLIGTIYHISNMTACMKSGDFSCEKHHVYHAQQWYAQGELSASVVHPILGALIHPSVPDTYDRMWSIFSSGLKAVSDSMSLDVSSCSISPLSTIAPTKEEGGSQAVCVQQVKKVIPLLRTSFDYMVGSLNMLSNSQVFPFAQSRVRKSLTSMESSLLEWRGVLGTIEQLIRIYPSLGGFKAPNKFLVLLQNNSELRPTGGFIGSIARFDVSEGTIQSFNVEDVYAIDGQLKGHVDPPQPFIDLWGQEHWYLRDSNWHPDFVESASMARWFYEKETGERVDSVIAVTSSFIVRLLKIVGPVLIADYNDTVTAENFYQKSHYYTQVDFFPGSTQKRDFLGALSNALLGKIMKDKTVGGIAVVRAVHDALTSHDIELYVSDRDSQNALEEYGWAGRVPQTSSCTFDAVEKPCIFSYVYINEANMSVNKVNMYIDRSEKRTITIAPDGTITENLIRTIKNVSHGEAGSGPYTAYIRILIPHATSVQSFTINGKPVPTKDPKNGKPVLPYGVIEEPIGGTYVLGAALSVSPQDSTEIGVSFTHTKKMLFGTSGSTVSLYEQKQPGVDSVPSILSLEYPAVWQMEATTKGDWEPSLANPGKHEYNSNLSEDNELTVSFVPHP